jgi:hypothetical protein
VLYDLGYGNTDLTLKQIKHKYPLTFPRAWVDKNR